MQRSFLKNPIHSGSVFVYSAVDMVCSELPHVRNLDVLTFAHFIVFLTETVCLYSSFGFFITIFVYFVRSWSTFSKWIIMSVLGWKKIGTVENLNYVESQLKSTVCICANSSYLKYFHIFSYFSNSF